MQHTNTMLVCPKCGHAFGDNNFVMRTCNKCRKVNIPVIYALYKFEKDKKRDIRNAWIRTWILVFILALMLIALFAKAQTKDVIVFVEDHQTEQGSLYYDMKYGLKTWLDEDPEWIEVGNDSFYSIFYDAKIDLTLISADQWAQATLIFIDSVRACSNDHLWVYVGHNSLLDQNVDDYNGDCSPNLLFGCMTDNWEGVVDNTIISTTDYFAPEAYVVLPAVEAWIRGKSKTYIRNVSAENYSLFQEIDINKSLRIIR